MVVFSCDGCAEVLKKNQVDAHANRCNRCFSVSCADCLVSFPGDDYRTHTSCMTEVERYETKGRATKNTKVSPQQQWMDLLSSSVDSCPAHLKSYLRTMASLDNVPRKEKQFRNFAKNSLHLHARDSERVLSEIWKFLMDVKEQQRPQQQQTTTQDTNQSTDRELKDSFAQEVSEKTTDGPALGSAGDTVEIKPDKGSDENGPDDLTSEVVKKAMKRVLKEAKDNSLPLKRLRKTLRQQLGISKDGKGKLKRLIKANLSKKYILEGKVVRLQVH